MFKIKPNTEFMAKGRTCLVKYCENPEDISGYKYLVHVLEEGNKPEKWYILPEAYIIKSLTESGKGPEYYQYLSNFN